MCRWRAFSAWISDFSEAKYESINVSISNSFRHVQFRRRKELWRAESRDFEIRIRIRKCGLSEGLCSPPFNNARQVRFLARIRGIFKSTMEIRKYALRNDFCGVVTSVEFSFLEASIPIFFKSILWISKRGLFKYLRYIWWCVWSDFLSLTWMSAVKDKHYGWAVSGSLWYDRFDLFIRVMLICAIMICYQMMESTTT